MKIKTHRASGRIEETTQTEGASQACGLCVKFREKQNPTQVLTGADL
jgi:hypothetical protein